MANYFIVFNGSGGFSKKEKTKIGEHLSEIFKTHCRGEVLRYSDSDRAIKVTNVDAAVVHAIKKIPGVSHMLGWLSSV